MGGNAWIIEGRVDLARFTQPGFLGRLFGKKPMTEADLTRDFIDLPAKDFQFLGREFRKFLESSLEPTWPATKAVLDYLAIATTIYLRGEGKGASERKWYLQLSFSGCAGMAQVSSDLAAHWASRWYEAQQESLRPILVGLGFTPGAMEGGLEDGVRFLPIGELGYASHVPGHTPEEEENPCEFEFDEAVFEASEGDVDPIAAALRSNASHLLADQRCHCQMCDPTLALGPLRKLPGAS